MDSMFGNWELSSLILLIYLYDKPKPGPALPIILQTINIKTLLYILIQSIKINHLHNDRQSLSRIY